MTSPRFLLDTNILSDLARRPRGAVAARIGAVGEAAVCTSIIVAAELRFGAVKKGSAQLDARIDSLLSAIDILPFDTPADRAYARLRWALEQAGTPIGPNDMLIAAQALAHDCVLVSANIDEFSRVAGLRVENWLEESRA
jgi:tRNA(fMet)-specific endonuclease VapC